MEQSPKHFGHHLVHTAVYGPVSSRRYGTTIGINLLPAFQKHCSFDCVYCQLGWTPKKSRKEKQQFPTPKDVITALKKTLENLENNNVSIVFSGNGEPTLYPHFSDVITKIVSLRNAFDAKIQIICFTNGTTLKDLSILKALSQIDECCVKADAAPDRINKPCSPYSFSDQIDFINKLPNLVIQSCFLSGDKKNATDKDVQKWIASIKDLNPKRIDLYTLSRNTPHVGLEAVSLERLEEIREKLRKDFSCPITVSGSD